MIGWARPILFPRGKDGPGHRVAATPGVEVDGGIGEFTGIFVVNLLLTIITIGIYRFWAITRWRRYFWSHMAFQEERFEYTGRGGKLFLGALFGAGRLDRVECPAELLSDFLLAGPSGTGFHLAMVALYLTFFLLGAARAFQRSATVSAARCGVVYGAACKVRRSLMACAASSILCCCRLRCSSCCPGRKSASRSRGSTRAGSAVRRSVAAAARALCICHTW